MAIWVGQYTDSYGRVLYASLPVYLEANTLGQTTRVQTTLAEDRLILPQTFQALTVPQGSRARGQTCDRFYGVRFARFFISATTWYYVPIPFPPESNNWVSFWNDASNDLTIINFEYFGETLINDLIPKNNA